MGNILKNAWPKPPEDTPETRRQLHAAIRNQENKAVILEWINRGTDPSKCCDDGNNAYSLARSCGYTEAFCGEMDKAFLKWLQPLEDTLPIYITGDGKSLWPILEQHGWVIYMGSSLPLAFIELPFQIFNLPPQAGICGHASLDPLCRTADGAVVRHAERRTDIGKRHPAGAARQIDGDISRQVFDPTS